MKKHFVSLGITAVVGLSLLACQNKEIDFVTPQGDGPVFYALMEQVIEPDTRVYADENLMVLWHADDRVGIFNKYTYNQQYRFTGETGANSGTFTKVPSEDFVTGNAIPAIYAVYPYAESTTITNDCKIQLTLPAEQAYSTLNFGPGANTMVSATEDNNLLFKNLGGYLAVKLYGDNVTVSKVTLRGNKSEKLAGHATVTAPLDGDPTVVMAEDATEEITVNCAEPVTIGTSAENYTEFWFVLPPTTFDEGFTITVIDQYGGTFVKSTSKPVDIPRNHLSRMSPIEVQPDYTDQLATEREALVEFYQALDGDHWFHHDNWCSDKQVDFWYGVDVDEKGFVVRMDFNCNNLRGELPECLSQFSHLRYLRLSYNDKLSGSLPDSILNSDWFMYQWADVLVETDIHISISQIPAPSFSIVDKDGNLLESDDLYEKNRLLVFCEWPQGWTDCFDYLIPFYRAHKDDGLMIIGMVPKNLESDYQENESHFPWPSAVLDGYVNYIRPGNESYPDQMNPNVTVIDCETRRLVFNSWYPVSGGWDCTPCIMDYYPNTVSLVGLVPPANEIWYISSTGNPIDSFDLSGFDMDMVSHISENGICKIKFSGPILSIPSGTFQECVSLLEISLPNGILEIGRRAFSECKYLRRAYLPDSCMAIGEFAFSNCERLSALDFPDSLESIDQWAFGDCRSLETIVFPEGIKTIGWCSFCGCLGVKGVIHIPESVDNLNPTAFNACQGIELFTGKYATADGLGLVFEESDMVIFGQFALGNNSCLDYIIPDTVTHLASDSFGHSQFVKRVVVPEGVPNIPWQTFYYSSVEEVILPESLREIGSEAFCGSQIRTISIPKGVTTLYPLCFNNCVNLTHIEIEAPIEELPDYSFTNCINLSSILLPRSLVRLNMNVFSNCQHLKDIYCMALIPPRLKNVTNLRWTDQEDYAFHVPIQSLSFYKSSDGWASISDHIIGYSYDNLEPVDFYISSDYSQDGLVTVLNTGSSGSKNNLVLMGDGFSDRQIADGSYARCMGGAMEAFFSEEPYRSFRNHFNVYSVNVVSATEGYEHSGQSLGTGFGDGTYVFGNDSEVIGYAQNAISEDLLDDALIIVLMNKDAYAGTNFMYSSPGGDYGRGLSIAYFPTNSDTETFSGLVLHEAGGHGFAKLADEYVYPGTTPTAYDIEGYQGDHRYGRWMNLDFTTDEELIVWSRFLKDERYTSERIGIYEGALFEYGAYRPTENSIMRYNTGGFNAPSRYAIWYRINKLAYGESWNGTYEDFVEYDTVNRTPAAIARRKARNYVEKPLPPLAPPVIVGHSWREEMQR